jgi:signal transduction histidine kinase
MKAQPVPLKSHGTHVPGMSAHVERIRTEERARLAQELHDELGALFMAAKLNVAGLRARCGPLGAEVQVRLQQLMELLDAGLAIKTRVVDGLPPSDLLRLGLVPALAHLAQDIRDRTEIATHTRLENVSLDEGAQLGVYRLVQKCFTKIGKHADATYVTVDLQDGPGQATVAVADNGMGFDPSDVTRRTRGVAGMRRRFETSGARIAFDSGPGAGTRGGAVLPQPVVAHGQHARKRMLAQSCVR